MRGTALPLFLLACIAGAEETVTTADVRRWGESGEVARVRQVFFHASEPLRYEAAMYLARLAPKTPTLVAVLTRAMRSESWHVRWRACQALGEVAHPGPHGLVALAAALKDEDPLVVRAATTALGCVAPKDERAAEALVEALRSDSEIDRGAILFALRNAGPAARPAVEWIGRHLSVLDDPHGRGTRFLDTIGIQTPTIYIDLLGSDDATIQALAVSRLRSLDFWGLVLPARGAGTPDTVAYRLRTVQALRRIGRDGRSIPSLLLLAGDPDAGVRTSATNGLSTFGSAWSQLVQARRDGDALVCRLHLPRTEGAWNGIRRVLTGGREASDAVLDALAALPSDRDELAAELEQYLIRRGDDAAAQLLVAALYPDLKRARALLKRAAAIHGEEAKRVEARLTKRENGAPAPPKAEKD